MFELLNLNPIESSDIYLSFICSIVGFFLLLLLIILKKNVKQVWISRKVVHMLGGTFIAFVAIFFKTFLGLILAICIFLLIFIILIISSKIILLKEYFALNFRAGERNLTFITNTATTLITLFILLLAFSEQPEIFTAGALIVAWADSAGEFFGKIYPLKKFHILNEKSISGTMGVLFLSLVSFFITALYYQILINPTFFWKVLIASLICTIIELLSWKWLDNIFLSISGSLMMFWIIFTS